MLATDTVHGTSKSCAAEQAGYTYDFLKSLLKRRHPDTGEPTLTKDSLELAYTPMHDPLGWFTSRPGFGIMSMGFSHNLRTTDGIDYEAQLLGGGLNQSYRSITKTVSGSTSQSLVDNANTSWTAGRWTHHPVVVYDATNARVSWGYCTGSTVSAAAQATIFVDQWYDANSATFAALALSAAAGNPFAILPGSTPALWLALTTTASFTPAAGDHTLSNEYNSNGISRVLATYAHTGAATSYSFAYTYTFTGSTLTTFYGAGLFTGSVPAGAVNSNTAAAGGGVLFLESGFQPTPGTSSATVSNNGDQVAVNQWVVNI